MFERFTEPARQVVVFAQEEARALKHSYIGTEHILLGLLREENGLAARVLATLGVTLEGVRVQVRRIVGSGEEVTSGQIPFQPRAQKALELALREALSLGHNYIGTEHLLLGIVHENKGVATRILLDFGADAGRVRYEVFRMLGGPVGHRPEPAGAPGGDPRAAAGAATTHVLDDAARRACEAPLLKAMRRRMEDVERLHAARDEIDQRLAQIETLRRERDAAIDAAIADIERLLADAGSEP